MTFKDKASFDTFKKARIEDQKKPQDLHPDDMIAFDYEPAEYSWGALPPM